MNDVEGDAVALVTFRRPSLHAPLVYDGPLAIVEGVTTQVVRQPGTASIARPCRRSPPGHGACANVAGALPDAVPGVGVRCGSRDIPRIASGRLHQWFRRGRVDATGAASVVVTRRCRLKASDAHPTLRASAWLESAPRESKAEGHGARLASRVGLRVHG